MIISITMLKVICLLVVGLIYHEIPGTEGKTEEEWTTAINDLLTDIADFYRNGDIEGFRSLLAEDVHRLSPHGNVTIGREGIVINKTYEDSYELRLSSIRMICDDCVAFEYTVTYGHGESKHFGTGLGLAEYENGTLKLKSFSWSIKT